MERSRMKKDIIIVILLTILYAIYLSYTIGYTHCIEISEEEPFCEDAESFDERWEGYEMCTYKTRNVCLVPINAKFRIIN